jgi:hypothetical protein
MYNFMQKTNETFKTNYEIDKKFREEQLEEDARRHKKLIESLTSNKTKKLEPVKKEEEKEPSWVDKMLGGMKKTVTSLLGGIFKVFGSSLGLIFSALTSIATIIAPILGLLTGLIGSIITAVASALAAPIKLLIGELLTRFVIGVVSKLAAASLTALGGPLLAGLAALGAVAGLVEYNNLERDIREGPEAQKYENEKTQLESKYNDAMGSGLSGAITDAAAIQKEMDEIEKNRNKSTKKYRKEVLSPLMEAEGWKTKEEKGNIVFKKGDKESTFIDEFEVKKKHDLKEGMFDFAKTATDYAKKEVKELTGYDVDELQTKGKNLLTDIEGIKNQLPKELILNSNETTGSDSTIVNNSVNAVKEKPEIIDVNPLSVRNNNLSVNKSTRGITATW